MSQKMDFSKLAVSAELVKHTAKIYRYPCGIVDVIASDKPDFCATGWERSGWQPEQRLPVSEEQKRKSADPHGEDLERSMRRARAKLRRLALANTFHWFVTLTLDPDKVDSKNGVDVVKKLNAWCSNAVQRHGLCYLLVPERHKKGGIHFHGFFNDALPVVDSGTMRPPAGGRPRKPRSEAQRNKWLSDGWTIVYNLPGWSLGFTTALELTGEYPAAVAYVCKYIGKDGEKPAGRWYYSGGDLKEPAVSYAELAPSELLSEYSERAVALSVPGRQVVVLNGLREGEWEKKP